jgi:hypothetical protein
MITSQSMKAGFTGGLVVDYPNSTKAKKFFLVLMTGGSQPLPQVLCGVTRDITYRFYIIRYRNRPDFGHYPNIGHFWLFCILYHNFEICHYFSDVKLAKNS